jgi:hypothetical protein
MLQAILNNGLAISFYFRFLSTLPYNHASSDEPCN